jgi:hypothetical protein
MSGGLFQGDALAAMEYYEGRRREVIAEPIIRLMMAVFDVAWADASYNGGLLRRIKRRKEAVDWFVNPKGSETPFGFGYVCKVLGYDVDATRVKMCARLAREEPRALMRRPRSANRRMRKR